VNSYVEVFKESNDPEIEDSQRAYLNAYKPFDHVAKYRRLIQVKNGQGEADGASLRDRLAPAYLEHCLDMAEYGEGHGRRHIKLERVAARLPTSFVAVKYDGGGDIIWQMNHHSPRLDAPDAERMESVFIVSDPDGVLVHYFIDWFNELDTGWRSPVDSSQLR
jgi:hypothetical protein